MDGCLLRLPMTKAGLRPVWNVWQRKIFQSVFLPPILWVKTLPEQPLDIYINPDNKSILIKYYGGKFEVVGYDSKPFPQKKKTEILDEIRTTAEEFNNGISKVINFAAADELRPIMNSVSIETAPGEIIFVSSNGHGLGLFKRKKQCCTETCSVIISRQ